MSLRGATSTEYFEILEGKPLWRPGNAVCQIGSWMSELEQGLGRSISRGKFSFNGRRRGGMLWCVGGQFVGIYPGRCSRADLSPAQLTSVVAECCQFGVDDAELDWI